MSVLSITFIDSLRGNKLNDKLIDIETTLILITIIFQRTNIFYLTKIICALNCYENVTLKTN